MRTERSTTCIRSPRAANRCWPGKGAQLSLLWRAKQLEYTWQRSLMQRYAPFSTVTREALAYSCEALELELSVAQMEGADGRVPEPFACTRMWSATLQALKTRKAILSNGSPDMLRRWCRTPGSSSTP